MSDFTSQIAQAVAAARPQYTGGGRGPVQLPGTHVQEGSNTAAMAAGEAFTRQFNKDFSFYNDKTALAERARQAQQLLLSLPDETRKQYLKRPDVQQQLSKYRSAVPELFTDAGEQWEDSSLSGMLDFINPLRTSQEQQTRGEARSPYQASQAYRQAEAGIESTQAGTEATRQDIRYREQAIPTQVATLREQLEGIRQANVQGKKTAPIELDRLIKITQQLEQQLKMGSSQLNVQQATEGAQIQQAKTGTAIQQEQFEQAKVDTKLKKETYPDVTQQTHLNTELAQANLQRIYQQMDLAKKDFAADQMKAALKTRRDDLEAAYTARRKFEDDLMEKHKHLLAFNAVPYALDNINGTMSLVQAMGVVREKLSQDVAVAVPAVLKEPLGEFWVTGSLNTAFNAFVQKESSLPPDQLAPLYREAKKLYDNVYGQLPDELAHLAPIEIQKRLLYMQYQVYGATNMTPEQREVTLQALKDFDAKPAKRNSILWSIISGLKHHVAGGGE